MKYLVVLLVALFSLNFGSTKSGSVELPRQVETINLTAELVNKSKSDDLVDVTRNLVRFVDKTPYVFSGSSDSGWDCSGLVRWTYEQVGVELPHSADKQAHSGYRVSVAKPGDIVVFAYKGRTDFYHSAIYLGGGRIINANRSFGTTKIQLLNEYADSQIRFVRIF